MLHATARQLAAHPRKDGSDSRTVPSSSGDNNNNTCRSAAIEVGLRSHKSVSQRPSSSSPPQLPPLPFSARVHQRPNSRRSPRPATLPGAAQRSTAGARGVAPAPAALCDQPPTLTVTPSPPPPRASASASASAVVDDGVEEDNVSRHYFASYRRSFHVQSRAAAQEASARHCAALVRELVAWERAMRDQLLRHERREMAAVAHAAEGVLLPVIPALRHVSSLTVPQREVVSRWSVVDDYLQLLLDATVQEEAVWRRELCHVQEPAARRRIENGEVPHWIATRKLEGMRIEGTQEEASRQSDEQLRRMARLQHAQQQRYQIQLLEEGEGADRMEVERLQRLHVGGLAEVMAKEYRRARACQLQYEAARHPLTAALSHEITAAEALARSMAFQDQAQAFKALQATEVRSYLALVR